MARWVKPEVSPPKLLFFLSCNNNSCVFLFQVLFQCKCFPKWVNYMIWIWKVYPLMAAMGFVTTMCVFQLTRNILINPDVRYFLFYYSGLESSPLVEAFLKNKRNQFFFKECNLLLLLGWIKSTVEWECWRTERKERSTHSTPSGGSSGHGPLKSCPLLIAFSLKTNNFNQHFAFNSFFFYLYSLLFNLFLWM